MALSSRFTVEIFLRRLHRFISIRRATKFRIDAINDRRRIARDRRHATVNLLNIRTILRLLSLLVTDIRANLNALNDNILRIIFDNARDSNLLNRFGTLINRMDRLIGFNLILFILMDLINLIRMVTNIFNFRHHGFTYLQINLRTKVISTDLFRIDIQ